ncbi:MAG: Rossmann-fold NAD(P)-binding domain-containing protein [Rhodospirillales bacterium]
MIERLARPCGSGEDQVVCEVTPVRVEDKPNPDFDVFINNASVGFCQVELLDSYFRLWRHDPSKYIINISSRAALPNISKGYLYAARKAALNHYASNIVYNSDKKCRVTTLNLGLLERDLPSLTYREAAEMTAFLIGLPRHIEIPEMTVHHAHNYLDVQARKAALPQ